MNVKLNNNNRNGVRCMERRRSIVFNVKATSHHTKKMHLALRHLTNIENTKKRSNSAVVFVNMRCELACIGTVYKTYSHDGEKLSNTNNHEKKKIVVVRLEIGRHGVPTTCTTDTGCTYVHIYKDGFIVFVYFQLYNRVSFSDEI